LSLYKICLARADLTTLSPGILFPIGLVDVNLFYMNTNLNVMAEATLMALASILYHGQTSKNLSSKRR
jgi:hypothetical protein